MEISSFSFHSPHHKKFENCQTGEKISFRPPSTDSFQICQLQNLISSFHGAILANFQNAEVLLIFFTNRALAAFFPARILKIKRKKKQETFS